MPTAEQAETLRSAEEMRLINEDPPQEQEKPEEQEKPQTSVLRVSAPMNDTQLVSWIAAQLLGQPNTRTVPVAVMVAVELICEAMFVVRTDGLKTVFAEVAARHSREGSVNLVRPE